MDYMTMDGDDNGLWHWNWTELCGIRGSIRPINPNTRDLGTCFQQLCLQIPVLAFLAMLSAYYCGKRTVLISRSNRTYYVIVLRLFITACLALLPIIKAYIILSNATMLPLHRDIANINDKSADSDNNLNIPFIVVKPTTDANEPNIVVEAEEVMQKIGTAVKGIFHENNSLPHTATSSSAVREATHSYVVYNNIENVATSAKPIDYLVAGTEGLAWVVHFCFVLGLSNGNQFNPRGPVSIRALLFLLMGISILLLRSHVKHAPPDDTLPNLSLGFSIATVMLLILYAITLIPGSASFVEHSQVGEHTALLNSHGHSVTFFHDGFLEERDPSYLGTAMEDATVISKLLFHWVTPLMQKGVKGLLNHSDDLYDLPVDVSTSSVSHDVNRYIHDQIQKRRGYLSVDATSASYIPEILVVSEAPRISLLKLLHKCFGIQCYAVGILKFIADCSGFMGPILLNKLVGFIEDKSEQLSLGYMYAALLFLSTLAGAFCNSHFTFWSSVIGLKMRAAIVTLVYRKTLHSSNIELTKEFTFGEIVNFMSTDADRIVNSCPSFHTLWSIPLQLVVTLYLLHNQLGISFLAGVAFAIILIPINKVIANKIGTLSTKLMDCKDKRVRLMGETLRGVTTIRFNVWEEYFLDRILKLRDSEVKYLKGRKYLDALCVYFWATTPVLISILTFATYSLLGNNLDAKTVFTSMALLNMLIGPLNAFPWVLNGLTEAWVSIKRIQRFMELPDLDPDAYYSDPPVGIDVMLRHATFKVNTQETFLPPAPASNNMVSPASSSDSRKIVTFEDENSFTLQDINITIPKGQLIGIMGKVGSGKSTLLDAVLAEITKEDGIIAVNDLDKGFGYVKQSPWLQRATVRDNILFGKAYDHNKYKNILKACALTEDLNNLPKGDLTGVSESGDSLSGGQKTRITLARAVYADKDIYLLDDILATLDLKVANYIFQAVILGVLKDKTRILCTHHTQYLIHADSVVHMSRGRVINQGKPSDILPDLEEYLLATDSIDSDLEVASVKELPEDIGPVDSADKDSLLGEEHFERGTVQFNVYTSYLKSIGNYLVISIFLSMILMQGSKNFTDLWLSYWVTHINATMNSTDSVQQQTGKLFSFLDEYETNNVKYYLTIYGILATINSFCTLLRAFLFAYGGIQAAITIHKQLLKIILKARTTFFDIHPLGRILNRFSSDTYTVDDSLPFIANILLAQFFGLVGSIIITIYGLPWIFLVLAPLVPMYHWLQNHYRLTSRELKRLSSTTLSPVYGHFNETLQGLSSIRAFRATSRFKRENELFVEANQKSQFASLAAAQWLALRLQFIGVALLGGVALIAVIQHQFDVADPGLIGLTIAYALSITGLLSGVVNAFTETEREMIAVERVKQYLENTPCEPVNGNHPPYAWPSQGVVEFKEVILKYREHLVPSLNGVSFTTRPAEKIGVVGRTGAGKSSILVSLFRLIEIESGKILIDNVDTMGLSLKALRSRLSIIPQDPFLFLGTIRENIDPLHQYPDSQVYKALEKCKVHSLVHRMGGLGAVLDEGGKNLSAGQKQLFCLVRAVLHNAKILCIDEATANVDQQTDKYIQTTIKSSFRSATVITIAHRIRTILHCDRVLVMGDGEVLEFDEPDILMQDSTSYFYQLASQEFSEKE
ncbi:ATP-binding cassette sub-family C member 10 isoform X1 [Neodiprion pinetum]|uniref:ATP-binding cassette sub-family C member 10 isoform X1 n=2 Tax=Neodiprion pinetum TaxID=441929 RepID=UPI001EDED460|nr:ATP-binding cassette sub-family C member 10 isoform X1 [Neodiprion pinetum]